MRLKAASRSSPRGTLPTSEPCHGAGVKTRSRQPATCELRGEIGRRPRNASAAAGRSPASRRPPLGRDSDRTADPDQRDRRAARRMPCPARAVKSRIAAGPMAAFQSSTTKTTENLGAWRRDGAAQRPPSRPIVRPRGERLAQTVGDPPRTCTRLGRANARARIAGGGFGSRRWLAQYGRLAQARLRENDICRCPARSQYTRRDNASSWEGRGTYGESGRVERIARQPPVSKPHASILPFRAASGRERACRAGIGEPGTTGRRARSRRSPSRGPLQDRIRWDSIFDQTGRRDVPDRFYCPDPPRDGRFRLSPDESRHLVRVCRAERRGSRRDLRRPGLRDRRRRGRPCAAIASSWSPSASRSPMPEPACSLVLATAVPKGDRFDWLVEKATELGVDRLIPDSSPIGRSSSRGARSWTGCGGRSSRHRNNAGGRG